MTGTKQHHRSNAGIGLRVGFVAALWVAAGTAGCGTDLGRPLVYDECGGAARQLAEEVVVLDWGGGVSSIYPNDPFDGLDFSAFKTTDGGTLADRADEFKALVRSHVSQIYCDLADHSIAVMQRKDAASRGAKTVVYFAQFVAPNDGGQVGEAEFDPCNRYAADEAIIFAEQYLRLGGPFSFEEWVTMFANTAAHEIGHTLGYGHISRADRPDVGRSAFVELMLDRHTLSELQSPQRIVVNQSTCPVGKLSNGKVQTSGDDLIFICGGPIGR